jgi:hypothetical protein
MWRFILLALAPLNVSLNGPAGAVWPTGGIPRAETANGVLAPAGLPCSNDGRGRRPSGFVGPAPLGASSLRRQCRYLSARAVSVMPRAWPGGWRRRRPL